MTQKEAFLDWLSRYMSAESILAAYEKETAKQKEELKKYMIKQLRAKLSPCYNCSEQQRNICSLRSYPDCNDIVEFNTTIKELVTDFVGQSNDKAILTAEQQLEAIAREIHIANLKGSDQSDRYKWAVEHIQNIIQPY